MKISETLASHMAELMSPFSAQEILMPKTAAEIFANQADWYPQFDTHGTLIGFFEYRTHEDTQLAEMGSVLSLQSGVGKCLLQIFNTQKDIRGASGGFAVTKNLNTAQHFFVEHTDGDLRGTDEFPAWFNRASADKYFVQWR